MKRLLLLLAFPLVAFALPVDQQEANDRMATLEAQRNEQANRVVVLAAELGKAQRALDAAKKAAEACKPEEKK